MRILFAVVRAIVAVAITAAVAGQLATSLAFWTERGDEDIATDVVNFFSFFTVQSNIAAAVTLAIGAFLLLRRSGPDPRWLAVLLTCVATYMITTGIVYNLLLRGIELPQGSTLGWSNEILHAVGPLYLLVDRLFAPGTRPLPARTIGIAVIYPIVWGVYTLVRAPFTFDYVSGTTGWYPYPFLNPALSPSGYLSVAFYIVLIALVISAVAAGVLWLSRRRRGRSDDQGGARPQGDGGARRRLENS